MKNERAVVALVIFLLGFGCCAVAVHAATPATLYTTSMPNMTAPSETTVGIYLNNSFQPAIGSLTFSLKYDEDALEVRKITVRGGGINPQSHSSPLIIAFATTTGIPNGDTWLANITFVSKTTTGSTTNLVIESSVIDDVSIPPIDHLKDVTVQGGIITVGPASGSSVTQEPTPQPVSYSSDESPSGISVTTTVTTSLTPTIAPPTTQQPAPTVTGNPQVTETGIQQTAAVPSSQTTTSNLVTPQLSIPVSQKSPGLGIGIALAGIGVWMITHKKR